MAAINFTNLLIDLYNIYNTDKLSDVERIVINYNGREFDAVKAVYIKYNFKQSPFYDPNIGTDKHVKSLIESYSQGSRVLTKDFINNEKTVQDKIKKEEQDRFVDGQKKEEEKRKIEEERRRSEEEDKKMQISKLQDKIDSQEKNVNEKLKTTNEELKKELSELKEQINKGAIDTPVYQTIEIVEKKCPFIIQLKYNFEEEVVVPDISNFLYVSINQRMILNKKDGGIIGVIVEDVLDNYIEGDSPVREIILNKV